MSDSGTLRRYLVALTMPNRFPLGRPAGRGERAAPDEAAGPGQPAGPPQLEEPFGGGASAWLLGTRCSGWDSAALARDGVS